MKLNKMGGRTRFFSIVTPLVITLGVLSATPAVAMADTSKSIASGTTTASVQTINWGGGGSDHGGGHGGGHGGSGSGGGDVPETPYAAVFPLAALALTVFVYKRRKKQCEVSE